MCLGPTFDGGRKQGVPESEGCGGESGSCGWVGILIIAIKVPVLQQDKVMLVHNLLAQDHGQELVVGDVLDERGVDVTSFLKKGGNY